MFYKYFLAIFFCCFMGVAKEGSYSYEISSPESAKELSAYQFTLPAEALYNLGGYSEKIRLYNKDGEVVPYMVRQKTFHKKRLIFRKLGASASTVKKCADGSLEMIFNLHDGSVQPSKIQINTSMKNFEQQVQIYGYNKAKGNWILLLGDGFLFDSSQNLQAKKLSIPFDSQNFRSFKLVFSQASLERRQALRKIRNVWKENTPDLKEQADVVVTQNFKIDEVQFWGWKMAVTEQKLSYLSFKAVTNSIKIEKPFNQVVELLHNSNAVFPICGIRVQCENKNFSRKIEILMKNNTLLGEIFSVELPGFRNRDTDFLFKTPVQSPQPITFKILNGENPPLKLGDFEWIVPEFEFSFLCEKKLFPIKVTADPEGVNPKYKQDEIIQEVLRRLTPYPVSLKNGSGNRIEVKSVSAHTETPGWQRWIMWIGVVTAVVIMGFGIFAAGKKIDEIDEK